MLSVIAASRNDGHGLNLIPRTQAFINGLAEQANRYQRDIEVVLVEWNPPPESPPLREVLAQPERNHFDLRIISVPASIHHRLAGSERLSFFQMIAKNVGIRRAEGRAVLATNIDIVLSDELFLDATGHLEDRTLYRADRADIPFKAGEEGDPGELRRRQPIRWNRKSGINYPATGKSYPHIRGPVALVRAFLSNPVEFARRVTSWSARSGPPGLSRYRRSIIEVLLLPGVHLNACGDFTLMTRDSWNELRGYPQWELFSWNLDSLLLYQAAAAQFRFVDFDGHPAYHLEHSAGWSPESHEALFDRLTNEGISVLTDAALLDVATCMLRSSRGRCWRTNLDDWGFVTSKLEERHVASSPDEDSTSMYAPGM